jgi:nucleotide-binding universal stress UspA family protein
MSGIVVGVDGSPHSQQALDWALAESALRHVPLTVLAVAPVAANLWAVWAPPSYPADEPGREQIQQATQELVDKAVARRGGTPGTVTVRAVIGLPADELIKASEGSDLLIVGARGAGGFTKLMMGSVSSQVSHHARCPVVVVPGADVR